MALAQASRYVSRISRKASIGSGGFPFAACSSLIFQLLFLAQQTVEPAFHGRPTAAQAGGPSHSTHHSITTGLCGYDRLEWLGDDIEHRLLSLNQRIDAGLERVGCRVAGDAELLLGSFHGRLVLIRVIVKGFLLRRNRILNRLLEQVRHTLRYFGRRSTTLFGEAGHHMALLNRQVDGVLLGFHKSRERLPDQVKQEQAWSLRDVVKSL